MLQSTRQLRQVFEASNALLGTKSSRECVGMCFMKHCRVLEIEVIDHLINSLLILQKNYKSWYCMPPTSGDADSGDNKKRKANPGSLLRRKIPRLDAGQ